MPADQTNSVGPWPSEWAHLANQFYWTNQKYFVYLFFSTSTRLEDQTNSVEPWPSEWAHLDKPVLLDQLNLILNLNQARGLNQLSWTLTFRVSTSRQTSSIGSTQPGPAKQHWFRLRHSKLSKSLNFNSHKITAQKFIALHKGNFRRSFWSCFCPD